MNSPPAMPNSVKKRDTASGRTLGPSGYVSRLIRSRRAPDNSNCFKRLVSRSNKVRIPWRSMLQRIASHPSAAPQSPRHSRNVIFSPSPISYHRAPRMRCAGAGPFFGSSASHPAESTIVMQLRRSRAPTLPAVSPPKPQSSSPTQKKRHCKCSAANRQRVFRIRQ
jgi:hypothetical protein